MVDTNDMEGEGFSLADLAGLDVSGIEEVRFIQLPSGDYEWEVINTNLEEDEKDGDRRFKITFELKIVEVKAVLEANVDKDSLVGKIFEERFFIKPKESQEDVAKAIGRVRAFITDTNGNSKGALGEIVANHKGATFRAQIVKQKDRNDKSIEYARLKVPAKKDA